MPDEKQTQEDEQNARAVQEQEMEDLEPRSEDTANVAGGKDSLDSGFIRR